MRVEVCRVCDVVNSSGSSITSSAVSPSCSVSASVCPTSAALMTQLNMAQTAGDLLRTRTSTVDKALPLPMATAGRPSNITDCQQIQLPFPSSQASADTDLKSQSSVPADQACAAAEYWKTQLSFPPSPAFPVTGQNLQSSLITVQASAVADTRNSLPSCLSNFSSVETGESRLPYTSVDTAIVSTQSDAAVKCKSAVVNAAASVSRVCIICCIKDKTSVY